MSDKTGPTLVAIIDQLRPVEQEYLIERVKEVSGGEMELHRGLLPFLPAQTAMKALLHTIELKKEMETLDDNGTFKGEAFLRQLLSKLQRLLPTKLFDDEKSEVFHLSDQKLQRDYPYRFSKSFCLRAGRNYPDVGWMNCLIKLEWQSKNLWKVTASAANWQRAAKWLVDSLSF